MQGISLIINTKNEEDNIKDCIRSAKKFVNEIIVIDMESVDKTKTISKNEGAKVFNFKDVGYVEPARNSSIKKASYDWILILDADERLGDELGNTLIKIINEDNCDIVKIPRKNIIFSKWIEHTGWWPDYNIRFFKMGSVEWNEKIHSEPRTKGRVVELEALEKNAIIHFNYKTVEEFILRMNKYTSIEAESFENGIKISDFLVKPFEEFLKRYLIQKGFKDGIHGFCLSFLQSFYQFLIILKVWQKKGFKEIKFDLNDFEKVLNEKIANWKWWKREIKINESKNVIEKTYYKTKRKFGF